MDWLLKLWDILSRWQSRLLRKLLQKILPVTGSFLERTLVKAPREMLVKGPRKRWAGFRLRRLRKRVQNEAAEELLKWLVKWMNYVSDIDEEFNNDINRFVGHYQFMTADKSVQVAVLFNGKRREVIEGLIRDPDVTAVFFRVTDLINYVLAALKECHPGGEPPDALMLVLRHKVKIEGNVSYMMKFLYMANHVQLFVTGRVPQYKAH